MKCPLKFCSGSLTLEEEVSGSFTYEVNEEGLVDYDDKDFHGDSWNKLYCDTCSFEFDFIVDEHTQLITILDTE